VKQKHLSDRHLRSLQTQTPTAAPTNFPLAEGPEDEAHAAQIALLKRTLAERESTVRSQAERCAELDSLLALARAGSEAAGGRVREARAESEAARAEARRAGHEAEVARMTANRCVRGGGGKRLGCGFGVWQLDYTRIVLNPPPPLIVWDSTRHRPTKRLNARVNELVLATQAAEARAEGAESELARAAALHAREVKVCVWGGGASG
jgi:hypothetical protein